MDRIPRHRFAATPDIDLERSSSTSIAEEGAGNAAEISVAQDAEPPPRRRRVARRTRSSPSSFTRSGDPGSDLANIVDADALFRWALEILPAATSSMMRSGPPSMRPFWQELTRSGQTLSF